MREIKFRAWDKDAERWVSMGLRSCYIGDKEINCISGYCRQNEEYVDAEVMQFIGIKDKNGVEIYEGDIVETQLGNIFEIGFKDGKFGCMDDGYLMTFGNEREVMKKIKIIGNIYENKELLYKANGVTKKEKDNYIKD